MTQALATLPQTFISAVEGMSPEALLELGYWERILRYLQASLAPELLARLRFHMLFANGSVRVKAEPGFVNVFVVSDEEQTARPELYDGQSIVFQAYYSPARFKRLYDKLYPFPLGYNGKLDLEDYVPFAERSVNVFFSGNLHKGRRSIFNYYSRLRYLPFTLQHRIQARLGSNFDRKYPDSYLRFTSGFMRGLNFAEYTHYLKNSRIVLSPHGSVSEECFRHYEALKCGCIVISERLPDNYFLSGSPVLQVSDWTEGDRLIRALLADPARMESLHRAALAWWQQVLSEPAVAAYMRQILERELAG